MEIEGILSEEERARGFSLEEEEDLVFLLRYGQVLAVFSSHGVTIEKLREFLDRGKVAREAIKKSSDRGKRGAVG